MLNDIIEKYFLDDIILYKNKKVSDDDFYILKYNEKDKLLDTNYTLNQLKKIADIINCQLETKNYCVKNL